MKKKRNRNPRGKNYNRTEESTELQMQTIHLYLSSVFHIHALMHNLCFSLSFSLPEHAQTHVHRVSNAIQPPRPWLSPTPLAFNLSQHQGLF